MRVAILVLLMVSFSPAAHAVGGEEPEEIPTVVLEDILGTYSRSVQIAFERVSDIDSYEEAELAVVDSWLVVTGIPIKEHRWTEAEPEESKPVEHLRGSYIWTFEDSTKGLEKLRSSFLKGEIESFSPLLDRSVSTRFEPNDPFYDDQWHLNNTGQTSGTSGEDANVTAVWNSYNGSGVVISVIDDGVEHSHPDLTTNYLSQHSYDWCGDDPDPDPNSWDGHGTAVAGVAAGTGNNSIGVTGAAFGANIAGHRLIACGFTDSTAADALSYDNGDIDIYSNSWGPTDDGSSLEGPGPITIAAIEDSIYNGRSGLGNIYTWAAGNGLEANDNSNYDGYASLRYAIAVSAITHYGDQSWYSEPGANILVTAHSNGGTPDYEGITTTDITGTGGYSGGDVNHDFGGTSSATPLVSGVIALILESNPDLTWRDVQNILVHSSRKNDVNDSSWTVNGGGLNVSHKYGFGAVDAGAAVSLAENWTSSGEEANATFGPFTENLVIDNGPSAWTEFNLSVPIDLSLESVDVIVDITHTARGELDIVLESPSGHQSWLAEVHDDNNADYSNWRFGTVQHWDESSQGNWILKVRDSVTGSNSGTLNSWELIFHGVGNVTDTDGDGWPDYNDLDDDNDGWVDIDEMSCSTDPLDNSSTPSDTDSDGVCNYLDSDDDGDGLSDLNETSVHLTDPLDSDSDDDGLDDYQEVVIYGTKAIDNDTDDDGLGDYQEVMVHSTNPLSYDSDSDGISDYDEIAVWFSDPLTFDADNDSDDYYHFQDCDDDDIEVNPGMLEILNGKDDDCDGLEDEGFNDSDADGDGLSDWEEFHIHGTNPEDSDSDGDGIPDRQEFEFGSNPLVVDLDADGDGAYWFDDCDDNDSSFAPDVTESLDGLDNDCDEDIDEDFFWIDTDMDGLTDYAEYHQYSTDPNDGDSDGDGLPDGTELNEFMSDPLVADSDSDLDGWYHFQDCDDDDFERAPERPEDLDGKDNDCDDLVDEDFYERDTDGDGLSDYSEYHNYSTSFDSADTDQDGVDDGTEIARGLSSPIFTDYDRDNDGFYEYDDCDDLVGSTYPGAVEQWNGVDDDCDGEEDEFLNRLGLILSNYDKSSGTVFLENGNIYDGPRAYSSIPVTWDSANESFEISVYGIQSSVDAVITWSMSGYSLEVNTSQDGKTVILMPIHCRDTEESMQIQFCDEGSSIQKLKAVVSEDGYYTEIEWDIMVTIWVEPQSMNWLSSIFSSPTGIIGIVTFLIALSAGGFLIGIRISRAKELQDALEAYGVNPERLAISPENRGVVLPSAPDISWSNDENP
ncbi:MAG: S8 family serine peptidase [Candidatus Thalassarchaeum sp.]|nr:S8 family serine peptidase [Candidatus Thalassarchaeum sp.]